MFGRLEWARLFSSVMAVLLAGLLVAGFLIAGCSSDDVEIAGSFEVRQVASGLQQPTQIMMLDDGRLLAAQLSGGENDETGSVVAVDLADGSTDVWFEGLDKPTGVAVISDTVWIMERNSLSRGPVGGGTTEVVLADLAYNGRSEGTLTTRNDRSLLFNTSGRRAGNERVAGSATIWQYDPAWSGPTEFAVGIQNAYAQVVDDEGTVWSVDISGSNADSGIPDSLVAVAAGDDLGWPQCAAAGGFPISAYGGTPELCPDERRVVRFGGGSTPTSITIAPWDPDLLVVALWSLGNVVTVPRPTDSGPSDIEVLYSDFERPQHVLAVGDEVFVADHATGTVVAIGPA